MSCPRAGMIALTLAIAMLAGLTTSDVAASASSSRVELDCSTISVGAMEKLAGGHPLKPASSTSSNGKGSTITNCIYYGLPPLVDVLWTTDQTRAEYESDLKCYHKLGMRTIGIRGLGDAAVQLVQGKGLITEIVVLKGSNEVTVSGALPVQQVETIIRYALRFM